jgi:hypothetical protein
MLWALRETDSPQNEAYVVIKNSSAHNKFAAWIIWKLKAEK